MPRSAAFLVVLCLAFAPGIQAQAPQPPAGPEQALPVVRDIRIAGAHEVNEADILHAAGVESGQPLPVPPDRLGARVERAYHDQGYTFARASAAFEAASGALTLTIDEGVIEGVEFQGVDESLARRFADDYALRAGDVFKLDRAQHALEALLRETRGAIRPGRLNGGGSTFADSRDLGRRQGTFDLVDRGGRRVLLVGLREPGGRFKMTADLGEREDWFTPVDGFVPSLGFGAAVFDHAHFNHAFVAGHLSFRTASDSVGYALGFERPLFDGTKLYLGGELHDLTATDDDWQVSPLEASLAAIGPRRSYRDYFRRRGIQINADLRVHRQVELLFAWRGEREEPLPDRTDFSFWNGDDEFRPNVQAQPGRLRSLVVGASIDGRGFDRESLQATYRRHQLDSMFGERLNEVDPRDDFWSVWRVDWTTEISAPRAFGSDFDFSRHILAGRMRLPLSEHQEFAVRGIAGWSGGVLPPQRLFAVGGIGSVHGYDFKQEVGDTLTLVNLEYTLGWRHGLKGIGFFDAGRATAPAVGSEPWLTGVGVGVGVGDFRVDFGYKLDAIPSSLQVLLRFERTF